MPDAVDLIPSKAPAIARAAAILRLLGRSATPRGLQSIARELDLVPSTCLYVLRALVTEDLVAFDPVTKTYALDIGVLALARDWLRRDRFVDAAQPVLERLAATFNVTALAVQASGLEHITVVAVARAAGGIHLDVGVGSRFPALISATGRCLAAYGDRDPDDLAARFAALRWDAPPHLSDWLADVAEVRQRGFAVDDGNYIAGVTVVAAPVWHREPVPGHAVVALGLAGEVRRAGLNDLQNEIRAAAKNLSQRSRDAITD